MRIVAPVSRLSEIAPLAQAGASEFYCGLVPPEWLGRFHALSANRRPSGNLKSYTDLAAAVELAHAHGAMLSLVLNAQNYPAAQAEAVVEIAQRFADIGGDALIVSDLGLVHLLAARFPALRVHVSSVATCRNAAAARLCLELGARRLILPRDVTIDEAAGIAAEVPDIEIEAFILNDGCVFEEGACHTIHLPGQMGGPICLDRYQYRYRRRDGGELPARVAARLRENDEAYERWLWYRFSCGFSTTPEGLPYGPCGLCAIPALRRGQVAAIKIAGREAPTARKLASVRMVKSVVDRVRGGADDAAVRDFAMALRPSEAHCATGFMCYYPEVLRAEAN
ncbi:U32 family peptidase [Thauera linaloolentis]|uniref:Peptidase U32 n=1 Tax=Thauera linaloolentis (strain DSM 12138 / JCM 21573 / CCUG 41526 / CIP 105981 / IAM 15112 / NBRC 102519 / 47Lol) TaxID=1123367 RepID=N6XP81_THAL4|nr:U32 family peptidase [Thauera linaloolentis]ENO83491.1 peptidase U32 [Thauera linaloolentis 47Lol = DSM 12138]MCM8567116.1 U32 family peptidase [Thauera linaloolentis]